jgi:alkyl sulfatase BDS1-like metallo-beta-lactamase superfamily hydrolase
MTTSTGSVSLIAPTVDITKTGQGETVDGIRMEFQVTPGTEAPAEMNFYLPGWRALCMAENATHTLHNILTLRGALVRDARIWSRYLTESIRLFGDRSEVVFASHHWPTWGQDRLVRYMSEQRDLYAYLHDQTLRLVNAGHTGIEIAEMIELPPAIDHAWHARGYYGSISHNVKAIYQRYMGWFDGNPSDLWAHPPVAAATRYVECLGGTEAVVAKATEYVESGDLRFAAELLKHAVFADPEHAVAKERLAATYDRLGHGAENGPWRDFFLTGASELRSGIRPLGLVIASPDLIASLSVEQLFDSIAVKVNGPRVQDERITIDWIFHDLDQTYRTTLANGVLTPEPDPLPGGVDLTLVLSKPDLLRILAGGGTGGVETRGDTQVLDRLLAGLDEGDPNFPIVTP